MPGIKSTKMTEDNNKRPVGELYFDHSLYGEDMVRLREGLEDIGFDLDIDPLQDQATLKIVEDPDKLEPTE